MCGRYYLDTLPATLREHFSISGVPELSVSHNIAPTQTAPIIRQSGAGRELVMARWGLIPFWARDQKIGQRLINARAETLAEKPAFRNAWKRRRCLIPASGFYEWQRRGKRTRQPHVITSPVQVLLAFGGIWETWDQTDPPLTSFSILTTRPNSLVAPIHDRMPVIIDPEEFDPWLSGDAADLQHCLRPCDAALLDAYPVGTAVNSPANNNPDLLRPVAVLDG